jgi:hypothetical protein
MTGSALGLLSTSRDGGCAVRREGVGVLCGELWDLFFMLNTSCFFGIGMVHRYLVVNSQ